MLSLRKGVSCDNRCNLKASLLCTASYNLVIRGLNVDSLVIWQNVSVLQTIGEYTFSKHNSPFNEGKGGGGPSFLSRGLKTVTYSCSVLFRLN